MKKIADRLALGLLVLLVIVLAAGVQVQGTVLEQQRVQLRNIVASPCGFKFKQEPASQQKKQPLVYVEEQ